jgi:RNA polymerase sigma-70 factor (ECF subfamily)
LDDEKQLMLKFSRGDEEAFANLFRKYYERVFRFAYRFCQNEESAADITQETFLRVYAAASRYNPRSRFSTYLYRVAMNLCLNELRFARRHPTVRLDPSLSESNATDKSAYLGSKSPSSLQRLQQEETELHVRRAISKLPEKQRTATILRHYDGMSYGEIAEVLGCSAAAVDGLLQRARRKLKKYLREYKEYEQ